MSGTLPSNLFMLPGLTKLYLHNNGFNGIIPDFIAENISDSKLLELVLYNNTLNGTFPNSFANLTNLSECYHFRIKICN
jgi:hypothetical protein